MRHALANSFNVAAVRMVTFLGLDTAIDTMQSLGMTTFENRSALAPALCSAAGR